MQLYILDRSKNVLATTASQYNDKHHKELTAGASSFQFDISKSDPATEYMVSGNYITKLDDQGRPWSFTILYYDEYQLYKTIYCEDVGIELYNKACDVWYYPDAHPFEYYFDLVTDGTPWELGINQLSDLSRSLKYTGRDTGLGRMLSILKAFDDAECIFNIQMNGPVPVKYVVDVYKHIGTVQDNIQIAYNEELNDIKKTETRQSFVTAIQGVGSVIQDTSEDAATETDTDKPQEYVDFADMEYDDGDFFTTKGDKFLRARTANQQFNPGDQGFIEDFYEYDTSSDAELFNRTLAKIRTRSQPQFTYEADVKVIDPNLDIGDTVTIIDHDYNPSLYLQARVATLEKSYTDITKGSITFTNYVVLTDTVTQQIAALRSKVNGIKNGSTSYVWIRYADDDQGTGISQSPKDKTYVAILAKVNQPVPSDDPNDYAGHWVRIVGEDGLDGQIGPQGPAGTNGIPGKDGASSYTHIAYANSADGASDFSVSESNRTYIGMYVDFTATDSTDHTKYAWTLVKGADGAKGIPGKVGADGKTPYLHIAYADSVDGKDGFYSGTPNNLYKDTKGFNSLSMWENGTVWTKVADLYRGFSVIQTTQDWNGISQYIPVKNGDTLTYSVYVKNTSGTGKSNIYWELNNPTEVDGIGNSYSTATASPINNSVTITDEWQRVAGTVTATSDGYLRPRIERTSLNTNTLQIAGIDVKKGSVATDWTPNVSEANPKYMGTYTNYTQADPTDPTQYLWSQIKGEAGANGLDGQDAYLHIAYANSVDGKTDFTTDQNQAHNRDYLGTYSDNTKAQSTDPTKYTWQLTRGAQGLQGQPGSKDVPVVTMSSTAPSSPKDGDFWYQTTIDSSGQKITGFSVYSGGKWVPSKIDQSTLVLTKLVSVEIDSATINSPDITVPFDYFDRSQNEYKGSMEFKDGMLKHISTTSGDEMLKTVVSPIGYTFDIYANQSEYTKNNSYIHTELYADNISLSNTNTKKSGILDSSGISGTLNDGTDQSINVSVSWEDVHKYLSEMSDMGSTRAFDWFDIMSSVQSHPNLLHNSTFINGKNNWDIGSAGYVSNDVHDGNFVLQMASPGGSNFCTQTLTNFPWSGNQICFSFWANIIKHDGGVNAGVFIEFTNGGTNYTATIQDAGKGLSTGWKFYSFNPITVPSGTSSIKFVFYNNEHNGNIIYFAQPMLNAGAHVAPYMPTY